MKQADKYLVYFDSRWSCFLFPNYKTTTNNNEKNLIQSFSNDLNINADDIEIRYISQDVREKYSVSAKTNKLYHHILYQLDLKNIPDVIKQSDFTVNDKHYYWKTVNELLSDKATYDFNSDIVHFVDEAIKQ